MSDDTQSLPFKTLGEKLKIIRQKLHESVAEVSGAVEIDEQQLSRIELGQERPTEDILLLLINHFGMQDDDAAKLWQLAGYDQPHNHDHEHNNNDPQNRAMVMIMAVDPRIMYSDGVQVVANNVGVTLHFSQGSGTPQPLTTARIGMSREQAYGLLHTLQNTLEQSKPRQLPSSQNSQNKNQNQTKKPNQNDKN
ncbi:MAG TPA: helix-turn-helix transcriptional regulator [Candidatus Saccharimonadales bacterium]|nr:helix-turn-helix transcriptional regulator [Candidatus Saccharimonadales bacterium]